MTYPVYQVSENNTPVAENIINVKYSYFQTTVPYISVQIGLIVNVSRQGFL